MKRRAMMLGGLAVTAAASTLAKVLPAADDDMNRARFEKMAEIYSSVIPVTMWDTIAISGISGMPHLNGRYSVIGIVDGNTQSEPA
jgi:hypothetical protein